MAADDGERTAIGDAAVIQLRIWQHVDDVENIWISARDGRWDTLGTVPFPRTTGEHVTQRYADLVIAGVELRVWQREPESIHVQVCGQCPVWDPVWRPLGAVHVPLTDGYSRSGRYRYGDVTIAVPRDNPGLLADRERLLALRDVLEGQGAPLNWDVGRAITRVGGSDCWRDAAASHRTDALRARAAGEIWGYLGDLTELTELRLDGNALSGRIPSKLDALQNLTHVSLAGNELEGCIPPPLAR